MMTEGIEIHFDQDEGHLRLDCDEKEFSQIRDLVLSGASGADRLAPIAGGIRSIIIRREAALREEGSGRLGRGAGLLLMALLLAVAAGIQIVGIIAVARWLLGHGS